jgi:hypothetical protein
MRRLAVLPSLLAFASSLPGSPLASEAALGAPGFGCPPELQMDFADTRACLESQAWWLNADSTPDTDAPFQSEHAHVMVPYPAGETILAKDGYYEFPFRATLFNFIGGTGHYVRGGNFLSGGTTPQVSMNNWKPTAMHEERSGVLRKKASEVIGTGKKENHFTLNTTSKHAKRMFQSSGWHTFVGTPGAPAGVTCRGWYEGHEYANVTLKDSNLGTGTGFQASVLASTPVPDDWTVSWSPAQGANEFFAYVNPQVHEGSKGIVVKEGVAGTSGTFTVDTRNLPVDVNYLLVGGWEKKATGSLAGVCRLPFLVG